MRAVRKIFPHHYLESFPFPFLEDLLYQDVLTRFGCWLDFRGIRDTGGVHVQVWEVLGGDGQLLGNRAVVSLLNGPSNPSSATGWNPMPSTREQSGTAGRASSLSMTTLPQPTTSATPLSRPFFIVLIFVNFEITA